MEEIREVTRFCIACAEPTLVIFESACPGDSRPAEALAAARQFAGGAPRSLAQRVSGPAAQRAGREAPNPAAGHAATAAGDAAASAYLHPLAQATQVRHILGAATHAACAAEIAHGHDSAAAHDALQAAVSRATPCVRDVLSRYPRPVVGRTRVSVLMCRLDGLLR